MSNITIDQLGDNPNLENTDFIHTNKAGTDYKSTLLDISPIVSAKSFGAIGDDAVDDTVALQTFIDFVIDNNARGYIEQGTYKITSKLNIKGSRDWSIYGSGERGSTIKQYTANTPILQFSLDAEGSGAYFGVSLRDIGLDYNTTVLIGHTDSNPIFFKEQWFHVDLNRIVFMAGHYGIKVRSGVGGPWGCTWDNFVFSSGLVAGAMQWTGAVNAVPNNNWGRFFVDATNMTDIIFNNIRGYNWVIGNIEVLSATTELIRFSAGSECSIGALKLEEGTYTSASRLVGAETLVKLKIGQFSLGGSTLTITPSGKLYLFELSLGGDTGWFELGTVQLAAATFSGSVYLIKGQVGKMRVKNIATDGKAWLLQDANSTTTAETLTVDQYIAGHESQDKGDSDFTATLGSENVIVYETPFTAPRTLNLPGPKDDLFNGLYYKVIIDGAVNSANILTIKSESVTKYIADTDDQVITFKWRRDSSNGHAGWVINTDAKNRLISAKNFGAVGDGVADDTTELQTFIDTVISGNLNGYIPSGNYLISAALEFGVSTDWSIHGDSYRATKITQDTDDTAIFKFGKDADPGGSYFNVEISDIGFEYTNTQTALDTDANCIFFNKNWFKIRFENLSFNGGLYGIRVKAGITVPGSSYWNNLSFGSELVGGAIDWSGTTAPKHMSWGIIDVDAANMANTVFKGIGGTSFTISNIKINNASTQLFQTLAGAKIDIGEFMLEGGTYTSSGDLFGIATNSFIDIKSLIIGSSTLTLNPSSGDLILFDTSQGGSTGRFNIDNLTMSTTTFGGNVYTIKGSTGKMSIGSMDLDGSAWKLHNAAGTTTAETLTIRDFIAGHMSSDKGDVDFTATLGSDNVIIYQTTLTAIRTINIPSDKDNLFNGLYYDIIMDGAVNGANTILIKSGGVLKYTSSTDKEAIRLTWRRDAANGHAGWVITNFSTLP